MHKKYPNLSATTVAIRNSFEQLVPTWPPILKTIKSIIQKIHPVNSCASTSTSKSYITGQAVKCNQSRWKIGGQCYLSSHQQCYSVKCTFFIRFCKIQIAQCQQEGEGWAEVTWGGKSKHQHSCRDEESAAALFPLANAFPSKLSSSVQWVTFIFFLCWTLGYAPLPCRWKWKLICKFSYLSSGNHSETCHITTVWGRDNKMPEDPCKMAERGVVVLTLQLTLDVLNYPEIFLFSPKNDLFYHVHFFLSFFTS